MGGFLLTLEGVEGAGKSTLADQLEAWLRATGEEVVRTREPGGSSLGEGVRALVLDPAHGEISPWAELFLMLAARAQLVHELVAPALARGAVVLCDRYMDASVAYQGAGRGLGVEQVRELNRLATLATPPHLTLLLDLDPAAGRARQSHRPDRMEQADAAFHERVREGYLAAAAAEPSRFARLDARLDPARLAREAWAALVNKRRSLPAEPPAA